MPRALRICLTLLGPAPIGLCSALFFECAHYLMVKPGNIGGLLKDRLSEYLALFPFTLASIFTSLFFSYLYAGLPSLIHMAVMEFAIYKGTDPRSWKFVGFSTLLGTFCSLVMGWLWGIEIVKSIPLGAWVGFAIGLLIKFMSERISPLRRRRRNSRHPREIVHD